MDTDFARRQMVKQQVRSWDVFDPEVLDVFAAVSRELFVPPAYRDFAFADAEIPLGHGQKMMTPTVEGRLLQALALARDDRVLEIGTGSGYLTACLSRLASSVCSVDIFDDFIVTAGSKLANAGINNVELACMDACDDLPDGEFDAIAVTGSLPSLDNRFVSRLRPGGRLFVIIGDPVLQEARIITCSNSKDWQNTALFETVVAPLVNSVAKAKFTF